MSIRTPELRTCGYRLLLVGSALALAGLVLPAAEVALGFAGSVLVVGGFAHDLVGLGLGLAGLVLLLTGLAGYSSLSHVMHSLSSNPSSQATLKKSCAYRGRA